MAENRKWVAISYNLPIQPSNARVYVWRKLKEIGAVPLRQGVAVLPASSTSAKLNELLKLSERIKAMNGEAVLFEMSFLNSKDEQRMSEKLYEQRRRDSDELIKKAGELVPELEGKNSASAQRKINKLIKQYRKIWEDDVQHQSDNAVKGMWEQFSSETTQATQLLKNLFKL